MNTVKIKDFAFLRTSDDTLFNRHQSSIDWIQDGNVIVNNPKRMSRKYRKKLDFEYIGTILGVPNIKAVVFNEKDII